MKVDNALDGSYTPYTEAMTIDAIKSMRNSTAVGPNGLNILHLKHLGPLGIKFLTRLFNLSVRKADIPAIWRSATVLPVPKPGKTMELRGVKVGQSETSHFDSIKISTILPQVDPT